MILFFSITACMPDSRVLTMCVFYPLADKNPTMAAMPGSSRCDRTPLVLHPFISNCRHGAYECDEKGKFVS